MSEDTNVSKLKYFGRAWKVTITTSPDNNSNVQNIVVFSDSWTPEPLDMNFDTYQTTTTAFWYCDISIYNLNLPTTQIVLKQGYTVRLEAGWQSQPYGVIFEGTLFQPIWERERGTDYKLTLHCLVGLVEDTNNWINKSYASNYTQRDLIAGIANNCLHPLDYSNTSDVNNDKRSSRGEVFFGRPGEFFSQIAMANGSSYWLSKTAVNIRKLKQQTENIPTLVYTADQIIDSPQQTQDGVNCLVYLDPRIIPGTQIQLQPGISIHQVRKQLNSYQTVLNKTGTYIVGGVRHFGESRNTAWYSEIVGLTPVGAILALQQP